MFFHLTPVCHLLYLVQSVPHFGNCFPNVRILPKFCFLWAKDEGETSLQRKDECGWEQGFCSEVSEKNVFFNVFLPHH